MLCSVRRSTKPVTLNLLEVFCAALYLLRSGCQWRLLPPNFPKWQNVYAYWRKLSEPDRHGMSALAQKLKRSGWRGPRETGAQRLKRVLDRGRAGREELGHGGPEGIWLGQEGLGHQAPHCGGYAELPHVTAVTTAEVTDRKGALQTLRSCKPALGRVQSVLRNSCYVGEPFAQGVREVLGEHVTVQIAKRSELHTVKVLPRYWGLSAALLGWKKTARGSPIPARSSPIWNSRDS